MDSPEIVVSTAVQKHLHLSGDSFSKMRSNPGSAKAAGDEPPSSKALVGDLMAFAVTYAILTEVRRGQLELMKRQMRGSRSCLHCFACTTSIGEGGPGCNDQIDVSMCCLYVFTDALPHAASPMWSFSFIVRWSGDQLRRLSPGNTPERLTESEHFDDRSTVQPHVE